jgi:Tfp pilus assembly protein PilZ
MLYAPCPSPKNQIFDLEEKHCLESSGVVQDVESVDSFRQNLGCITIDWREEDFSYWGGENMVTNAERRSYPRAEIRWPVTIKTDQGIIEAKLRNLGIGGAYIHCEQTLEAGEAVTLTIQPPTGSPLTITAKVVWAGKVLALGVGVHFVEMSDQDRQFISEAVSKLLSDTGIA